MNIHRNETLYRTRVPYAANAVAHDCGSVDRKSTSYKLGLRQLAEWHRVCEKRRRKAAKEKEQ